MNSYAITMLFAGIGIPILAVLNAALGRFIGSPIVAAAILFSVAFSTCVILSLVTGPQAILRASDAPRHLFLAGFLVAFYVLSITFIAPKFGLGNAVFFVLIGQLISAATIDHFGLFGAAVTPLSLMRALGLSVMGLGVWITQRAV